MSIAREKAIKEAFELREAFLDCANVDALMEGPKLKNWNIKKLNALWEKLINERIHGK